MKTGVLYTYIDMFALPKLNDYNDNDNDNRKRRLQVP